MNKILSYVLVAILLGTVTMVVPYVLLRSSNNTSLTDRDEFNQPSTAEPTTGTDQLTSEERGFSEEIDTESPSFLPADKPTAEEPKPTGYTMVESLSNLSPILLITMPSFLIALSASIYLKKRRL